MPLAANDEELAMKDSSTLVTFLGKGRDGPQTGYRSATYRFPDGSERTTPLFGFALAEHLGVDTLVVLGTSASQWGVVVEQLAEREEERIIHLMDAESAATVNQAMLDDVADLMSSGVGLSVVPRLIPFGKDAAEQIEILNTVAEATPNGRVSFDVTHGFRHLGMVGFQAAVMLSKTRNLQVDQIWYGALDMTAAGVTPVLELSGLTQVQKWTAALERFDATGDYGIFAPLLATDGVPQRKTEDLKKAAFFERTFNLPRAARKLHEFRSALERDLPGASGLFQRRLVERLAWIDEPTLFAQQRKLAFQYLKRADFVRAAVLAWEAYISRECDIQGRDASYFSERKAVTEERHKNAGLYPHETQKAHQDLNEIRNALAHSAVSTSPAIASLLADPPRLQQEIGRCIQRLIPTS